MAFNVEITGVQRFIINETILARMRNIRSLQNELPTVKNVNTAQRTEILTCPCNMHYII